MLATGSGVYEQHSTVGDARVRLMDAASGRVRRTFTIRRDAIGQLEFSPDGRTVAAVSSHGRIGLWRVP
jgi:hypothetical protein